MNMLVYQCGSTQGFDDLLWVLPIPSFLMSVDRISTVDLKNNLYIYICVCVLCMYIIMCIYLYRERERFREIDKWYCSSDVKEVTQS